MNTIQIQLSIESAVKRVEEAVLASAFLTATPDRYRFVEHDGTLRAETKINYAKLRADVHEYLTKGEPP